ncbi:hypothetical protein DRN50_03015 [Thermococci archaeon]|nr:MAG: hypothetical protein DRN50_03015 [Thermococci archaeon]
MIMRHDLITILKVKKMRVKKLSTGLTLLIVFAMLFSTFGCISEKEETPAPTTAAPTTAAPTTAAPTTAAPKVYEGLILPSGEKMAPMEILTLTPGADPTLNQEAVFIAEWWKKIGIDVEAKAMEKGALVQKIYWDRDFDATLWYIGGERFPLYLQYYYCEDEIYQYGWNFMQYRNPEYDSLSSEWLSIFDLDKAQERAFELQEMLAEDNPQIPLISDTKLTAYNNKKWEGWINQYGGVAGFDSMCTIDPVGGDTDNDILKIGLLKEPDTLNPLGTGFTETWTIINKIYCGGMWNPPTALYRYAPVSGELIPFLAEGDIEYDDATNTAIVKLKKGIKWHDGTELTAKDVKFTVDLMKEFEVPNYQDSVGFIDKVETIDDYTLKYYLTNKTVNFYHKTMMMIILQERKWSQIAEGARRKVDPTEYLTQCQITTPMGAGPFKFVEWKRGSYILLEKNPDWFFKDQTLPMGNDKLKYDLKVDKILFKFYASSETRILALKNGDIDICTIPAADIADFEADPDMTILEWGNDWLDFIGFNCTKPPFNDPAFRKALHYLIDKEFLVDKLQQGYAIAQYSVIPAINTFWCNPDCPTYGMGMSMEERIQKAIEILKGAGYTWESES